MPEADLRVGAEGEAAASDQIVGQELALEAVEQAVRMVAPGYNLYVAGLDGGGRLQTVARLIRGLHPARRVSRDLCYLHRFDDPSRPMLHSLPAGRGLALKSALQKLRLALQEQVPKALEAEALRSRRQATLDALEAGEGGAIVSLQRRMDQDGFAIMESDEDEDPVVIFKTEAGPMRRGDARLLADDEKVEDRPVAQVLEGFRTYEDALGRALVVVRAAARATSRAVDQLEREAVREALRPLLKAVRRAFPKLKGWLAELEAELTEHHAAFLPGSEPDPVAGVLFSALSVQVLCSAGPGAEAPVIVAPDPTFATLFGGVVTDGLQGQPPDHTRLRGGLLHDADGGFLVLDVADALAEPGVWKTLIRSMRFGQVGVQNLDVATQGACAALRPDPLPLDVKIVLVGNMSIFMGLHEGDEDFPAVFKVLAEFSSLVNYQPGLPRAVSGVLRRIGEREGLAPLREDGLGAIFEEAARAGGAGGKVLLDFGRMADLLREAQPRRSGAVVDAAAIRAAARARDARAGRAQVELHEELLRGTTKVLTEGVATGQVNGLSVLSVGAHRFGRPMRITATVGAGRGRGILNIERESGLSGGSFDKGVAVLQGWLTQRFGRERPLDLRASLAIEQSYGPIDGDSASLAELLALLSALGLVPLRQGVAVTGSLDQHGNVQPVGGVTEKVEGFFALCRDRGLQAGQGVIIPQDNVSDLMLDEEIVHAAAEGRFSVWAVSRVEEALALMAEADPALDPLAPVEHEVARLCKAGRRRSKGRS